MKILIFGLNDTGKTTLASVLAGHFMLPHYNADTIREFYDDWDFSEAGRLRQVERYKNFEFGILDFICPLDATREQLKADYFIWMDIHKEGIYADTNKMFEEPNNFDIRITEWIGLNQLHKCLEDFSPGIKGIKSFLNGPFQKLVK
jgi:hypothetical protein